MKRFFKVRYLLWTLVSLVTFYFLVVALENWTGARALAEARARVEAAGETLDFKRLLPPPIPDAANFCALKPLAGISDPKHQPAEAIKALNWQQRHPEVKRPSGFAAVRNGKPDDLVRWIAYLADIGIAKPNFTPANALQALDGSFPLLKTLSDAAPVRKSALFTPPLGEGQDGGPFAIQLPHYALVRPLAEALALRAQLAIASRNAEEAIHSTQACLRLVEAALAEPILIGQLVGVAMLSQAHEAIWALLHARIADDVQLAVLQADLGRIDHRASILVAARGEMAAMVETLRSMVNIFESFEVLKEGSSPSVRVRLGGWLVPRGFVDHSTATIINIDYEQIIEPLKKGTSTARAAAAKQLEGFRLEQPSLWKPHRILASLAVPSFSSVLRTIDSSDTVNRQATIAIAIDRHRLATGQLPAALRELVPVYLHAIPQDPMDDQPMRYLVKDGAYSLWSVALDRQDDQGRLPTEAEITKMRHADYKGDWVWHLPPPVN